MHDTIQFLIKHWALVLFAAILLDELGLPMPACPFFSLQAHSSLKTN
jgi:hypothetical protein